MSPARDVIIAPERGQVQVTGWVSEPGAYEISPGLTVLGAVAAAGGSHFGANRTRVSIARNARGGLKVTYRLDLERIESGEDPDLGIEPGDVVHVHAHAAKAPLWFVYYTVVSVLALGTVL